MKVNACTADFIWGFDNVCFKGSAHELAKQINSGYYKWPSSGLSVTDAKVINTKLIELMGIDARNFYQSRVDIAACK